jgi:RNA polymerase sigma-70 factor (ECF subfamily)
VEPGDGAVVRRVLGGDAEAFRILVERYRAAFGRYAVGFVGDADAAADAMQEAFIRAYDALATCRDPDKFGAWFFRILQNQCRTARGRTRETEDVDAVQLASTERADGETERAELAALLDAALASLTAEQREAFVLKHVEGRSYEEMAGLLGVGIDALKMRVHRARDALKEQLGGRL